MAQVPVPTQAPAPSAPPAPPVQVQRVQQPQIAQQDQPQAANLEVSIRSLLGYLYVFSSCLALFAQVVKFLIILACKAGTHTEFVLGAN